jgi:hypothetical protein
MPSSGFETCPGAAIVRICLACRSSLPDDPWKRIFRRYNREELGMPADPTELPVAKRKSATAGKRQSELTDAEKLKLGAGNIGSLFSELNSELNEIWEDFIAVDYYLREVHGQIKAKTLDRLVIPRLVSRSGMMPISVDATYGIISRIRERTSPRHAFIDAISAFEQFMSALVFQVYMDFPRKLKGLKAGDEEQKRQQKLLEVILGSEDRHEMIHKLVEEKVRGIFYGNPTELFTKDKVAIGFGNHFEANRRPQLEVFREMTARRNVIVHNKGRIDRKYLSEVGAGPLNYGQKVSIDEQYLKRAILIMKDLAADAAQLTATHVYREPLFGRAKKVQIAARKRPMK